MKKGIGAYEMANKASTTGLSKHALTMKIYKEIVKQLELCEFLFKNRKLLEFNQFIDRKGTTLAKVQKYVMYLIETMNRQTDPEVCEVFDKMYYYILNNAQLANKSMDVEALQEALKMARELVNIWDSIPENERY
ncbi:flagellar protein FliS [Vibrio sp. D431a]|uniref:flagellar protein FliS n=1 Tax=Vibrio sp. D431a TaxID=2837388 RepID=UPI0025525E0C|nr:flagellar protein FliS [Vibrio sp. D431a]MDK9793928.1 flagellar protein FliS [Vibrio sp. D431a]